MRDRILNGALWVVGVAQIVMAHIVASSWRADPDYARGAFLILAGFVAIELARWRTDEAR
jgi:hypothetical protein